MSWLWRSDSSPASFEKALAKLSAQISSASVSLDKTRSRNRRAKALWTLYTSLAYLLSALILVLVIGPQNWDIPHYGGLVGGPLLIFGVRKAITAVFGWSIARQQASIDRLQKQRDVKINDLKKATRYDSTQELLQKYGGAPPTKTPEEKPKEEAKKTGKSPQPQTPVQRTGLPPPPTANIPSRGGPVLPPKPLSPVQASRSPQGIMQSPVSMDEPGFAPNAFSEPPHSRATYEHSPHWYDRILDVMLGEDENLAKNRLVLLCHSCRLVNGQAPPGVKTLEELGRWRCQSCGAWNGTQVEAAKVVKDMTSSKELPPLPISNGGSGEGAPTPEAHEIEEREGSSGLASDNQDSVTKRVTRSAGKADLDGL